MGDFAPSRTVRDLSKLWNSDAMKDDHRYDALRSVDNECESESSTEVEEWDTEKVVRPRRKRKGFWAKARRYRWVVDTALLLVIVGLLVEKRWKKHGSHKKHQYEFTGDLTGFAPRFSQEIVTFQPDERFSPEDPAVFFSNETLDAWLSIVPEGLGYVEVKHPSKYDNLPHPIHDWPDNTVFTTSMTHQLHCLYTVIEAYNTLRLAVISPGVAPIKMHWHINHCFEYIRQSIMCAGDVALEGAATKFPLGKNGEDLGGSDGWDAKHVCKAYGEIYDYLERETLNHVKWIATTEE